MEDSKQEEIMTAEQITAAINKAVSEAIAPIIAQVQAFKSGTKTNGPEEGEVSPGVKQFLGEKYKIKEPQTPKPDSEPDQDKNPERPEEDEVSDATKQFLEYHQKQPHQGKEF
jgi:hypothetical protein